jgi:beta-phosphoglucomutase-like phosphatase (HAD superfamily)
MHRCTCQTSNLRLALFGLRGVLTDPGSFARPMALQQTFRHHGVNLPLTQFRHRVGQTDTDHIQYLLGQPEVQRQWVTHCGRHPEATDVIRVSDIYYDKFLPEFNRQRAQIIPGVATTLIKLRYERDFQLGLVIPSGKFLDGPDINALRNHGVFIHGFKTSFRQHLDAFQVPSSEVVGVSDTPSDIETLRGLGVWTVGVTTTSNEMLYEAGEFGKLSEAELETRRKRVRAKMLEAGAHKCIDDIVNLGLTLTRISEALARGEKP